MKSKLFLAGILAVVLLVATACDPTDQPSTEQPDTDEPGTEQPGTEPEPNDEDTIEYEYTEEGIIKPEIAEQVIEETANNAIIALRNKDAETLADYVHPEAGVRFTPYTYVSLDDDVVLTKEEMKNFFESQQEYLWGLYDGKGNEIKLTPAEYYEEFIYTEDFIEAEEIGYNEVLSSGNMLENQFDVYDNPIVVEYYFSGFNPDFEGMDWRSLRLVFEEHEGTWLLVGIIHNQWTI
ncbi:hypothetical protein [Desulfuribacillus alkaliarsenatis]|uniref:DUF4829 domain-containing protein n=1 Tax=Desulfuribacillus alkaliarsenatis TaxID=766136 RepID=A0A1E5G2Z6_9FIRM|nr:hypothetical protein [Desulfuribacillus alkaliarsenatis]OEF97446.1 hypothetical protein BHF68_04345 [Desulfuribacillus alkaliarsenatis]